MRRTCRLLIWYVWEEKRSILVINKEIINKVNLGIYSKDFNYEMEASWPRWIKVNTDGVSKVNLGAYATTSVNRDEKLVSFWVVSTFLLSVKTTFYAEILAAIVAIEIGHEKGWTHPWLKFDSILVVHMFQQQIFASSLDHSLIGWTAIFWLTRCIFGEVNSIVDYVVNLAVDFFFLLFGLIILLWI